SSRADLLASHIHRHHHWPTWRWWKSLATPTGSDVDAAQLVKAFLPVFRISRSAIDALLQAHREGWTGHFEVLVPTVVARHALRVEDLRANVPCYVDDSQDPNPIIPLQSTMRWRPEVRLQEFASRASGPLLFHPVKQNWAYEADGVRRWPEPQQGAGS
ncbi:MAG: hypothetical protein H7255_15895, partial [Ramlibacter sp.]|nr:hypothetical protein [Ramlibacter sp.]